MPINLLYDIIGYYTRNLFVFEVLTLKLRNRLSSQAYSLSRVLLDDYEVKNAFHMSYEDLRTYCE